MKYTINLEKAFKAIFPKENINAVKDPVLMLEDWVEENGEKFPECGEYFNHEITEFNTVKGIVYTRDQPSREFCYYEVCSKDVQPIPTLMEFVVEFKKDESPFESGSVHQGNWKYRND